MYIKSVIVLAELSDGTIHQVALDNDMQNEVSLKLLDMFPDSIHVLEEEILGVKIEYKSKKEENGN